MLTVGSDNYLLSLEAGPALSVRTAVDSEDDWAVATDAPVSLSPLSSSAVPIGERSFGGSEFGVFDRLSMCYKTSQRDLLAPIGHSMTYV